MSLAKQNFATASEEALNQQINTELQASQVYLSMSAWAQHTSVALPGNLSIPYFLSSLMLTCALGLEKYFRESAQEASCICCRCSFLSNSHV